jgi:hypothetical protein
MFKKVLKQINNGLLENLSQRTLKGMLVVSIALIMLSAPVIIHLLSASNYPGELERTQLGFDAEYIRKCLGSLEGDEISLFILGNLVDYAFMFSYGCLFLSSSLLLSRRLDQGSLGQRSGLIVSFLGVIAAVSDGFENVFILSMALDPLGFPDWFAFTHSLFAHIKFKLMYFSSLWIALAFIYVLSRKVINVEIF